jgi:UDP-N-acetylbacillosamine N-acetyltransferase
VSALEPLVIWGAGGHARVVADIVELAGVYRIVAFYADETTPGHSLGGIPIVCGRETLSQLRADCASRMLVAVGDCTRRLQLSELARRYGFTLATAIHPRSVVARSASVGAGTVVAAGAVINSGTCLGENVIVNTSASVDHDCRLAEGVHVAPGAHLAGNVSVGRATFIGVGSAIRDGKSIGEGTLVGAGSVVVADVPSHVVVYGNPARIQCRPGRGPGAGSGVGRSPG